MRFLLVLALLVLAPWVGEFLLGNISVRQLIALPFLVPLYGGGALLVREVARRTGRGWPAILLLATAYGVIEAGLIDQSMFNLTFEELDQVGVTPVPWLGVSAYNATAFVLGHTIWSIGVPIAMVEMWARDLRTTPWLGPWGLAATVPFYLLGCWIIFRDLRASEEFLASPTQLTAAALVAAVLIALAFVVPKRRPVGRLRVPPAWVVGIASFVLASAFFARPETWGGFWAGMVIVGLAAPLVALAARQAAWTVRHHLALVAGALLTYAWGGFVLTDIFEPDDPVRWIGNGAFALFAVALLLFTLWRVRSERPPPRVLGPSPAATQPADHGQ